MLKKVVAVAAATGGLVLAGAGMAAAVSGAQGAAVHSPGVLSGNVVQVPVLDAIIARKPSAILIAPTDTTQLVEPLRKAHDAGIPVIVVSTELDEVVGLADRIAVMYRGGIVGIVPADTSRDDLGLMMAGEMPAHLREAA